MVLSFSLDSLAHSFTPLLQSSVFTCSAPTQFKQADEIDDASHDLLPPGLCGGRGNHRRGQLGSGAPPAAREAGAAEGRRERAAGHLDRLHPALPVAWPPPNPRRPLYIPYRRPCCCIPHPNRIPARARGIAAAAAAAAASPSISGEHLCAVDRGSSCPVRGEAGRR